MSWKTSSCVQVQGKTGPSPNLLLSLLQYLWILFIFSVGYVAGFVDAEVRDRSDLFDVYVNLPDSEITVSQNAKG